MSVTLCSVEGCRNPVSRKQGRGGMCWGHYRRSLRQAPVDVELPEAVGRHSRLSPLDRLFEAALVLLEVRPSDKQGWRKARNRLRMAAIRYAKARQRRGAPHAPSDGG